MHIKNILIICYAYKLVLASFLPLFQIVYNVVGPSECLAKFLIEQKMKMYPNLLSNFIDTQRYTQIKIISKAKITLKIFFMEINI